MDYIIIIGCMILVPLFMQGIIYGYEKYYKRNTD